MGNPYYNTCCYDWRWSYKYNYAPLLKDLLKYVPYFDTEFITSEEYPEFEIIKEKVRLIDINSDLTDLDIALFTSAVIRDDNFLLNLKKNNIKIINQLGGNHFILMQEDLIFNQHDIIENIFQYD